jgi:mannose-1-phosphate guanylyltransferase/mannose-1-phosphate guanylyltransferase/mannose-6-phosphate isomerase
MLIPVILSGGSGTRLWPVSREAFPKPFMKLGGPLSLLQRTVSRCLPLADGRHIGVVTNREYQFKTQEELDGLPATAGLTCTQLLEPSGRNTAPAIAVAALWAESVDPSATLLVLPADHLIPDEAAFQACAREAAALAQDGSLVLFGIRPTAPETGFGYRSARARRARSAASSRSPMPPAPCSFWPRATSSGTAACSASPHGPSWTRWRPMHRMCCSRPASPGRPALAAPAPNA